MKLTWIGHSCFKVESQGYTIILDPYEDHAVPGLKPVREEADEVFCSHEHGDHNARGAVSLRKGGKSPFHVTRLLTYHDHHKGAKRGNNTITILDDGECRIAHMGDVGCMPEPELLAQLKNLDAVLIPVGGFYTIDAKEAKALAQEIQAKVVLPMHYRLKRAGLRVIGRLDAYTALCDDVIVYPGSEITLTKDMKKQTAVLQPQNV